jgi:hypothetical protein
MTKITCPKCAGKKLYKMSTGRRRCAHCKYDFFPHNLPLRFTRQEWREILHLFLMEQSSNSIAEQTGFDKKRVLRALLKNSNGPTAKETISTEWKDSGDILSVKSLPREVSREPGYPCTLLSMSGDTAIEQIQKE